jgi:hypothetical protein
MYKNAYFRGITLYSMTQGNYHLPNFILNHSIIFSEISLGDKWQYFINSELGKVYQSIPLDSLIDYCFKKPSSKKSSAGRKSTLGTRGEIGLMFLKSYSNLSDRDLIDRLNTDFSYQFFCNVVIDPLRPIKDEQLPNKIRVKLSKRIEWNEFQKQLAIYWKKDLDHTQICMQDATCYETSMRYPTDVKILFEAIQYLEKYMTKLCILLTIAMPRNKFKDQYLKTLSYLKQRKKTYKQTRKRVKSLLYLLEKQLNQMEKLLSVKGKNINLGGRFMRRLPIIREVLQQRKEWYLTRQTPKNLIVSIDKPYIRPIVRGKENKRVEFGAKVNMLQVDGINFIDLLSFEAFHEGNRLKQAIALHRQLFGKCTMVAADAIYATNENRTYCSTQKIQTNFIPKGKPTSDQTEKQQTQKLKALLNKERSTRLEGSFGTEKEIYGLKKIKARSRSTEMLWIYFGVHTRNAVQIASKREIQNQNQKAA